MERGTRRFLASREFVLRGEAYADVHTGGGGHVKGFKARMWRNWGRTVSMELVESRCTTQALHCVVPVTRRTRSEVFDERGRAALRGEQRVPKMCLMLEFVSAELYRSKRQRLSRSRTLYSLEV